MRWRPLKYFCDGPPQYGLNVPAAEYTTDGVRFLRTTDIGEDGTLVCATDGVFIDRGLVENPYRLRVGDLLFSRSGTLGRCLRYQATYGECTFAGYLVRFRPRRDADPRFLQYCSQAQFFQDAIAADAITSTISNFNAERYASLRCPWHELEQQRAIADYLDTETARIDALIAKKRRLLDLLAERRQSLITDAVTHGLGGTVPCRGPAAAPRGDGVSLWLRGRSLRWPTSPLKYVAKVVNGYPFAADQFNDASGTPVIRIRDLLAGSTETFFDGDVPPESMVNDGDLLIGMDGGFNSVTWRGGPAALNQRICRLVAGDELDARYLAYFIELPLQAINDVTYYTTVKHLSSLDLMNERIPLPPLDVQRAIADYLDTETARIDTLRAQLARSIELLAEHRQALITAAVTGRVHIGGPTR